MLSTFYYCYSLWFKLKCMTIHNTVMQYFLLMHSKDYISISFSSELLLLGQKVEKY